MTPMANKTSRSVIFSKFWRRIEEHIFYFIPRVHDFQINFVASVFKATWKYVDENIAIQVVNPNQWGDGSAEEN